MNSRESQSSDDIVQMQLKPNQAQLKLFPRRLNDYSSASNKSLIKDISLFSITSGPQYGGSSLGPHIKLNKQSLNQDINNSVNNSVNNSANNGINTSINNSANNGIKDGINNTINTGINKSIYYLAEHNLCEYFIYEILLRLGFNTPKARIIVDQPHKNMRMTTEASKYNLRFLVASKSIPDYLPISIFRPDTKRPNMPTNLLPIMENYSLDFTSQMIINSSEKISHKVSGNLFVFDLAAILCADMDLQAKGNNLGLVKINKRFYAVAIDKDDCAFTGKNYYQLRGKMNDETLDDPLFKAKTSEQLIALLYQIDSALKPDSNGYCDFDRIFNNPRVENTAYLKENARDNGDKFKKSATAILTYYKKELGKDYLEKFCFREELRQALAENILAKLPIEVASYGKEIMQLIIEDLRSPYYSTFFKNGFISADSLSNLDLHQAILADFRAEFDVGSSLGSGCEDGFASSFKL
jgi:hypothetical protein